MDNNKRQRLYLENLSVQHQFPTKQWIITVLHTFAPYKEVLGKNMHFSIENWQIFWSNTTIQTKQNKIKIGGNCRCTAEWKFSSEN